ncbi:MAG: DinB family protein [Terriglobia bacterium]
MMQELEKSRQALAEAVVGLTDEQTRQAPAPGKSSILDIVEHLAVSERGMFSGFAAAQTMDTPFGSHAKAAQRFEAVGAGLQAVEAPEAARPTGRFSDLKLALAAFDASRRQTIDFAIQNEARLDFLAARHPVAGPCSGYKLLMIMAGHTVRHTKQIWAIRS